MLRGARIQSLAVLVTYVAGWVSGHFVVICVEKDGRSHFEFALSECCGDVSAGEESRSLDPLLSAICGTAQVDGDCADCMDFTVSAPAVRIPKRAALDSALAALLMSAYPSGHWILQSDSSGETDEPLPDPEFPRRSGLFRTGLCVLLI